MVNATAEAFYVEALTELNRSKVPFLVGGTFAVNIYTNLNRPTKDLDIFCRASDFPKILSHFQKLGFNTEVEDERWLAKVRKGEFSFDVIFNSTIAVTPITDIWFKEAHEAALYKIKVMILSPTELIWTKVFIQDRYKFDGSDIVHLILIQSKQIDWRRLLGLMEQYWEVLFSYVIIFRFVYPTEREKIPRWLLDELVERLKLQADLPVSQEKICRGRLFSRSDYLKDVTEWGYADIVGKAGEKL
ncbi:nucleotidyltransferase family protein [Candidatus Parcubacteria bacterium]|nr:nucleotidyltransferase family protein [Candidatus Parcubacteria bacterium]